MEFQSGFPARVFSTFEIKINDPDHSIVLATVSYNGNGTPRWQDAGTGIMYRDEMVLGYREAPNRQRKPSKSVRKHEYVEDHGVPEPHKNGKPRGKSSLHRRVKPRPHNNSRR